MRYWVAAAAGMIMSAAAIAGEKHASDNLGFLDIDIWVNKGEASTYYYGEDIAVYFRATEDCYVVVYDIDPGGNVSLLFPTDYGDDCYVHGGDVYRIPDTYDDYRLEVTGPSGAEYIYAVATPRPIDAPDFIRYQFFEYGNWDSYYDDFIHSVHGERGAFAADLNYRIAGGGPYLSASTMFYIDENYRHHRWYRYWHHDPYYIGSVWVGCDYVGAEVWIDGCYYGIAPILIPEIYYGRHWIWIYYHGYPCWQEYFYVRSGQRSYVDAKINHRYRDFDYGRRNFSTWRFYQKEYRNSGDFKREAEQDRAKHVRAYAKPPTNVIQKYSRNVQSQERREFRENEGLKYEIKSDYRAPDRDRQAIEKRDIEVDKRGSDKSARESIQLEKRPDAEIKQKQPVQKPDGKYEKAPSKETPSQKSGKSEPTSRSKSEGKSDSGKQEKRGRK